MTSFVTVPAGYLVTQLERILLCAIRFIFPTLKSLWIFTDEEINDLFETVLHLNSRSDFFEQLNLPPNLSDLEYSQIMRTLKFYLNSKDFRKEKLSRKAEDYFRLVSGILSDKQLLAAYRRILEIRDQK